MNMEFFRKLPIPKELKEEYPVSPELSKRRIEMIGKIEDILAGRSDKLLLVIGPCSADSADPMLDYVSRLKGVQEKVQDKILIVPRVYTNKPRTNGEGYKGMLHQPDPNAESDIFKGIVETRKLHMRVLQETEMATADEMLYPDNHRYLSDLLAYVAVGARSVEDQFHRLTASGLDVPTGMKNPTSGDLSVMMNSINAAQHSHRFIYRGWEVKSEGNPYAHAIMRGSVNKHGQSLPNYHYEDLMLLCEKYEASGLENPAAIIDTNHSNSGKQYLEQVRISKEIMQSRKHSENIKTLVKGLMIESYIEDGCQKISDHDIYGKSITDPCLGWEKTERLIYDLADMV